MAYIPPHKRHSKDFERPTPTPESLVPQFNRNVHLRAPKPNADRSGKIVYSNYAISRWFAVGLDDGNSNSSAACLEPVSVESVERNTGEKPVILVWSNVDKENNEVRGSPWSSIAENVLPDLLSSFKIARAEIESQDLIEVKPTLVARFGKILFNGSPLVNLESVRKDCVTETTLRNLRRLFYTSLPASYVANIMAEVVPKIGLDFAEVKDTYHVKLSDSTRPDSTVSCKCTVKDDKRIQLYKVELNQVRDMVVDVSCFNLDLDLRLMLCHKRILTSLTDDEIQSIRNLIDSAVVDPDVKGGLRWPLGKASSGSRYSVVGVWHTMATSYQGLSTRLKVRHADRFDFKTGYGESSKEVVLKLKGVVSGLLEQEIDETVISDMLEDALRSPSVNLESVRKDCISETTLRNLRRLFYTSLPASYVGNIMAEVVPKIGLDFSEVKDTYHVKLSDNTRPDSTVSCKCTVKDDRRLQLYKVELNPVRDMVLDISCPDMDLNLRLALCHKRDDEVRSFRNLIDSAVVDPDVKGGLRWPIGKASSYDKRYSDRFDFKTGYGESSNEAVLNLKGMVSGLLEQEVDKTVISNMLEDALRSIWQHLLCCEPFLS